MNTPDEIRAALNQCIGTTQYFFNPLYPGMNYTDGVKMFAEMAECYWFLDIVGTEIAPMQREHEFLVIKLIVADSKATIDVSDGNLNPVYSRQIEWTDAPEGTWEFFLQNDVLLIPNEY
jgi:hypothetical protein